MPGAGEQEGGDAAEWRARTKRILKAELKRRRVTYAQLTTRLAAIGIRTTEHTVNGRINRGVFSAAFLLQVLAAVGAHELRLDELVARPCAKKR